MTGWRRSTLPSLRLKRDSELLSRMKTWTNLMRSFLEMLSLFSFLILFPLFARFFNVWGRLYSSKSSSGWRLQREIFCNKPSPSLSVLRGSPLQVRSRQISFIFGRNHFKWINHSARRKKTDYIYNYSSFHRSIFHRWKVSIIGSSKGSVAPERRRWNTNNTNYLLIKWLYH